MNTAVRTKTGKLCKDNMVFVACTKDGLAFIGNANREIKCGEIWMAQLPKKEGSIQGGYRPVLIISNDKNNKHSTVVNVVPMTTKMNKRKLPCHVEIWDYEQYGLTAPSTLMFEQITTIRKETILYRMGKIDDVKMLLQIVRAMQMQFPIFNS